MPTLSVWPLTEKQEKHLTLKSFIVVGVLFLASSSVAGAGTVYLTTIPTITGGCYFCSAIPPLHFGAYDGFVGGTIDGVSFTNWVGDMFQWDNSYQPVISTPSGPIAYTLTSFAGPGTDLSNVAWGWTGYPNYPFTLDYNTALTEYEEAALLLGGDGTTALPGLVNIDQSNTALVTAYQFAIYNVFTSTSTMAYWGNGLDPTAGGLAPPLLAQAQSDVASSTNYSATYSQLNIYTPTNQDLCVQGSFYWCGYNSEFLQFNTTATPEPGAMLLVGFAVLLLTAFGRFRRI